MVQFYDIFVLGGVFITLMLCSILIIKGNQQNHSNFFLAAILFCISWYAMIYLLINTGMIIKWSFLFGWGTSIYYLIPPLCYWYVKSVFQSGWKIKKTDLLHLIPALIGLIDAISIIFSPDKTTIIQSIVNDFGHIHLYNTTWIPNKVHFVMRPLQGLIYISAIWLLILPPWFKNRNFFRKKVNTNNHWLLIFTILMTMIYLTLAICTGIGMSSVNSAENNQLFDIIRTPLIWLAMSFFALGVYLFFNPNILYGWEQQQAVASEMPEKTTGRRTMKENDQDRKAEGINEQQIKIYVELLEKYIEKELPYRRKGININDFATETGIPARTLSYILNHHYKLRFTDFVNTYRLSYITSKLDEGGWKYMTLEGLAMEAGFSSRSTFFTSFKKLKGLSPSKYVENLEQKNRMN